MLVDFLLTMLGVASFFAVPMGIIWLFTERDKYFSMSLKDIEYINGDDSEVLATASLYVFGIPSGSIRLYGEAKNKYTAFYTVYSVDTGHEYSRGFKGDYFKHLFSRHIEAYNKKKLIQDKINKNYDYVLKNIDSELNEQFKALEEQQDRVNHLKARVGSVPQDAKEYAESYVDSVINKKIYQMSKKSY